MSEENQTPEPQWVAELKKWGIDVVTFREQWEQTGDEAKVQFQNALSKAQANYASEKSEFESKMEEVREDVGVFLKRLDGAWDEMVSNIQQSINSAAEEDENPEAKS